MKKLIKKSVINIIALSLAVLLFPSIYYTTPEVIILAGIVLGLINISIRPLLFLITLPVNLVTIGLFSLVINTWLVMIADWFIPGLIIPGFWLSFIIALIISCLNTIFQGFFFKEEY